MGFPAVFNRGPFEGRCHLPPRRISERSCADLLWIRCFAFSQRFLLRLVPCPKEWEDGIFSKPMPVGNGRLLQPTGKKFSINRCTMGQDYRRFDYQNPECLMAWLLHLSCCFHHLILFAFHRSFNCHFAMDFSDGFNYGKLKKNTRMQ
jgi:hypothetical protein